MSSFAMAISELRTLETELRLKFMSARGALEETATFLHAIQTRVKELEEQEKIEEREEDETFAVFAANLAREEEVPEEAPLDVDDEI